MKSFSRLCPQCQRPLIPNEMHCSFCNTYLPESRPNTTSSFPPPPPQYTDLSGQNWTQTGPTQGFSGEKIMSPQQSQSANKKLNRPLLAGGTLGVCFLLVVSFLLGKNLGTNGNPSTRAVLPISATASTQAALTSVTPTPSTQATLTSVASTPSTQATPASMAPTSLPTASLSSPQLPLRISCVNCPYPQLTVVLNSITVNKADQSTNWVFAISNTGRNSCSSLRFTSLELIDPYGSNYQGKGQAASDFAMGAEQSLQVNAVFALLPTAGTQYTLKLAIYIGYCNINTSYQANTYATENFTFA